MLIIQGIFDVPVSVDKITKFSIRPPELRHIFREVGNYFRWFYIEDGIMELDEMEVLIHEDIRYTSFVDGLKHRICVRVGSLDELNIHISSIFIDEEEVPVDIMVNLFSRIINLHRRYKDQDSHEDIDDYNSWCHIKEHILHDDDQKHLPIPMYSYVKPKMGTSFIFHILLSLVSFDTEFDLLLHNTLHG